MTKKIKKMGKKDWEKLVLANSTTPYDILSITAALMIKEWGDSSVKSLKISNAQLSYAKHVAKRIPDLKNRERTKENNAVEIEGWALMSTKRKNEILDIFYRMKYTKENPKAIDLLKKGLAKVNPVTVFVHE